MAYKRIMRTFGPLVADEASGALIVEGRSGAAMQDAAVDVAAGATGEIVAAPGAGRQIWVYGYELHAGVAAGTVVLKSGTTAKTGTMPMAVNGGVARDAEHPILKCADNEALNLTTVDCTIEGIVSYRVVEV